MFWETISDENCTMTMDCASNNNALHLNHVNMSGLRTSEELSLYADELDAGSTGSSGILPSSPTPLMLGLLSPEGSPRRFQIVSRKKSQPQQQQQQQLTANGALRSFHSLSSCSMDSSSMDDEYMELIEMETLELSESHSMLQFPSGLNSLISGQIVSGTTQARSPLPSPHIQRTSVRRCLSLTDAQIQQQQEQPKTPELLRTIQGNEASTPTNANVATFKRPDPPSHSNSPVQIKRSRSGARDKENLDKSYGMLRLGSATAGTQRKCSSPTTAPRPILRKCMSMNDAEIMTALARSDSEPELIGDFSKPFVLPLMDGRHCDLKSISSDTVARLLNNEFQNEVNSYTIIDCRYPYEFEGGHIRGALNLYTQEQIIEEFLTQKKTDKQEENVATADVKRNIIIFHCEFSSERGPKLLRFLRNLDRARNTNAYPTLDYPEIYLLHNGYKEFYLTHKELCDPIAYRPMLEPSFTEAYRHFRAKSKSWNGDGCGGTTSRHMKKSRSRLML